MVARSKRTVRENPKSHRDDATAATTSKGSSGKKKKTLGTPRIVTDKSVRTKASTNTGKANTLTKQKKQMPKIKPTSSRLARVPPRLATPKSKVKKGKVASKSPIASPYLVKKGEVASKTPLPPQQAHHPKPNLKVSTSMSSEGAEMSANPLSPSSKATDPNAWKIPSTPDRPENKPSAKGSQPGGGDNENAVAENGIANNESFDHSDYSFVTENGTMVSIADSVTFAMFLTDVKGFVVDKTGKMIPTGPEMVEMVQKTKGMVPDSVKNSINHTAKVLDPRDISGEELLASAKDISIVTKDVVIEETAGCATWSFASLCAGVGFVADAATAKNEAEMKEEVVEEAKNEVEMKEEVTEEAKSEVEMKEEVAEEAKSEVEMKEEVAEEAEKDTVTKAVQADDITSFASLLAKVGFVAAAATGTNEEMPVISPIAGEAVPPSPSEAELEDIPKADDEDEVFPPANEKFNFNEDEESDQVSLEISMNGADADHHAHRGVQQDLNNSASVTSNGMSAMTEESDMDMKEALRQIKDLNAEMERLLKQGNQEDIDLAEVLKERSKILCRRMGRSMAKASISAASTTGSISKKAAIKTGKVVGKASVSAAKSSKKGLGFALISTSKAMGSLGEKLAKSNGDKDCDATFSTGDNSTLSSRSRSRSGRSNQSARSKELGQGFALVSGGSRVSHASGRPPLAPIEI